MLGNIIWICPLAPGTSADVLIWDGYGPSRTRGDFFDFEVGGHDGAYKGQIHVIIGLPYGVAFLPTSESPLVYTCELWVFAICPALRGSTVSYVGDTHFPKHSLEYSVNFWSQSKKRKEKK